MILGLLGLFLFVLILVMVTLGAVLLARFMLGAAGSSLRIVAAAIGGPLALIMPVLTIVLSDSGARTGAEMVAVSVIMLSICSVIAWPIAHFATRRLDRLTQFDPQVFE